MKFRYLVLGFFLGTIFLLTSANLCTSSWDNSNYKLAQVVITIILYLTVVFIHYKEIKITLNKYTPKHPTNKPILDWNYEYHFWRNFKKKEYKIKVYRYALVTSIAIIFILMSTFFFRKERTIILLTCLSLSMVLLPLVPFTLGFFIENLKNELFKNSYKVQIYKKGIMINNKYFGYDYNWNSGNKIYLTKLEIVDHYSISCIEFTIERLYQGLSDVGPRDSTKIKKILIPIPQHEKVDLEWLKSKIIIRKTYFLRGIN